MPRPSVATYPANIPGYLSANTVAAYTANSDRCGRVAGEEWLPSGGTIDNRRMKAALAGAAFHTSDDVSPSRRVPRHHRKSVPHIVIRIGLIHACEVAYASWHRARSDLVSRYRLEPGWQSMAPTRIFLCHLPPHLAGAQHAKHAS